MTRIPDMPPQRDSRPTVRSLRLAIVCLVLPGIFSCDRTPQNQADGTIAARVGDEVFLVRDVEAEIAWRIGRGAMVPDPEAVLAEMIERRILVNKATAAGMDQDPDVRRGWENLLIGRYKEEHLRKDKRATEVSDEEIAAEYNAHPDRFRHPAKARLAILRTELPASADPDARKAAIARMREAMDLAAAPSDGPGFGSLAARYSDDDVTRHRGGDAGWLQDGVDYRWPSEVVEAGFALARGETAGPIDTGAAIFVVRKLDDRPASAIPLDQVRDQLHREIRSDRLQEVESSFAKRIREDVRIETFPESLSGVRIPSPSATGLASGEFPPGIP